MKTLALNVVDLADFRARERGAVNAETLPDLQVVVCRLIPAFYVVSARRCANLEQACGGAVGAVIAGRVDPNLQLQDASAPFVVSVSEIERSGVQRLIPEAFRVARVCTEWLANFWRS